MTEKITREQFLDSTRQLTVQSISQDRKQLQQLCVVAGALGAFMMPMYLSDRLTEADRTLVALSIASLLLCILVGMLHLSVVLTQEIKQLTDQRVAIEENDPEVLRRCLKNIKKRRALRNSPYVAGILVYVLFTLGIALIIGLFIHRQWTA